MFFYAVFMFSTGVVLATLHVGIDDWQFYIVLIFIALSYVLGYHRGIMESK